MALTDEALQIAIIKQIKLKTQGLGEVLDRKTETISEIANTEKEIRRLNIRLIELNGFEVRFKERLSHLEKQLKQ